VAGVGSIMTDESQSPAEGGPSQRGVEIGVAVTTLVFAAIVIIGSLQVGIGWGVEGPRAGFFPFYVALLIVVASVFNLASAFRDPDHAARFVHWGQARQVLSVLVPASIYVLVVPVIGIYVSSTVLLALFMKWFGGYRWALVLTIAIAVPVIFYFMFELWFLVPLPKGPLEDWLGL
jgi:putative tricarboxylic transport membrane protein